MGFVPDHDHDVFVSYAHIDNEPLAGAADGWVTTLVRNLTTIVRQKLGDREGRLDVWVDDELAGNVPFPAQIEAALGRTATLLVIMSPGYLASDWCRQEREAFRRVAASKARGVSQLFIVHRDRIDRRQMPAEFGELLGYSFWVESGRTSRTLGVPIPTSGEPEYYDRINQLGSELAGELQRLRGVGGPRTADPQAPAVFLAEVTDDLDPRREEVRRYLNQTGIPVLPTTYYSHDDAAAFAAAMAADLGQSKLFVQLLGPLPGRKPPSAPNGFPALQYDLARRHGATIVQWRSRDVDLEKVEDLQHRALLEADVVRACPIEELKQTIVAEVRRLPAPSKSRSAAEMLVFVNSDGPDRGLAEQICRILDGQGLGYSLAMQAGDPAEVRNDLEDNLRACDGLMLVYGATSVAWVRSQLRQCRKVLSQRDQPLTALAVFEGPPPDKVGLDLMLPNLQRLDCRNGVNDVALQAFVRSLKS
jgi:hypothetical protein